MRSGLEIEFDPPSAGWIDIRMRTAATEFRDGFSRIYDPLETLCSALSERAEGRPARRVVLLLEPNEIDLQFVALPGDRTRLAASRHRDHLRVAGHPGEMLLTFESGTRDLVRIFWRALRRLETRLPAEEFASAWGCPFPEFEMQALTKIVGSWKGPKRGNIQAG